LGEYTVRLDCDVIQADGGTRTASITGACVALYDAMASIDRTSAFKQFVAAISVGIIDGHALLDFEYTEDSNADTDMNIIMAEDGNFIEVQGTAEGETFSRKELNEMLDLGEKGVRELISLQKSVLGL